MRFFVFSNGCHFASNNGIITEIGRFLSFLFQLKAHKVKIKDCSYHCHHCCFIKTIFKMAANIQLLNVDINAKTML